MACAVCVLVIAGVGNLVFVLRDDGYGFLLCQFIAYLSNVEGLISKKSFEVCRFDQRRYTDRIVILPGDQIKADKIPKRINHCNDFCHSTSDTIADRLIFGSPFAS